jgi:seryl-tRNA(Sec) selenium transferase
MVATIQLNCPTSRQALIMIAIVNVLQNFISSYHNEPNLPTEADFPELNEDFQNLDVVDNTPSPMPVKVEEDEHIFENYSFEHTYSPKLPITNFQNEVLSTIESNSVTVVQGTAVIN